MVFFNKNRLFCIILAALYSMFNLIHKKMDTKKILITAAIAAAVVIALDFILPPRLTADGTTTRFGKKE